MRSRIKNVYLAVVCFCLFLPILAKAQSSHSDLGQQFFYAKPTLKAFSQMYWALGRMDVSDIDAIDNFLKINECKLYKEFHANEFEWQKIRASTQQFLKTQQKNFPLRFEFTQQLKLEAYDTKRNEFDIVKEYQIPATRRLQITASDVDQQPCPESMGYRGYLPSIMLELNRPVEFFKVSVPADVAAEYIAAKAKKLREIQKISTSQLKYYAARDAYIVLKVKVFSSEGIFDPGNGKRLAHVIGSLEGIEIYADLEKKQLLYSQQYRKRRKKSAFELSLIQEYQEKKRRKAEEKAKAEAEEKARAAQEDAGENIPATSESE